jgi:RND family efflux transporter MFP subunit
VPPSPAKDRAIQSPTKPTSPLPQVTAQTLPAVVPPALVPPVSPPPAATPKRGWWIWAVAGVVAVAVAALAYFQPWATPVVTVTVETMTLGPVSRVLAVNGRIAGLQSVEVRSLVTGTLDAVWVQEGDTATRDQTLITLDTAAQQAVLRQALAGLDSALVAQEDADATLTRTKALGANAARVTLDTATRTAERAAQEVARLTALLQQAQIQLDRFTLKAPIAGTVLLMQADPGQSVDPTGVLMTIADLGELVVETDVDESYATQVRVGQPAALQLSGQTEVLAGHVSFVSQRVEADTGGLAVKLTPDVPLIAPIGLTVTANITVDDRPVALTVPRAALVSTGDAVLVVTDGKAQRRAVAVIDWPAARLIVTDGLAAGDVVITDATGLTDGQAVKVAP